MLNSHHSLCRSIVMNCLFMLAFTIMARCGMHEKDMSGAKNPNGRNDAWGFMGYGGGGAMFNPVVSPFNRDYAFVSCDMTGAYVTYNGGETWRMFNLHSPVYFYVFDPHNSNVVYANSITLFKSTDRGNTWNVLYPDPAIIIGLVAKGDHAEEVVVTKDSTLRKVMALAIDPDHSKKLYAAISVDHNLAFYNSDDGGLHWNKEKELQGEVQNIFILPSSPKNNRTIYITGKNSVTMRENGTWKVNRGPEGVQRLTTFTGGFDKKKNKFIMYAISGLSYFNPEGDNSGIYYSEDGGLSWTRIKGYNFKWGKRVEMDPRNSEMIYIVTFGGGVWYGPARGDDKAIEDIQQSELFN